MEPLIVTEYWKTDTLAYYSKTTERDKLRSKQRFHKILSSLQWCLFETPVIIIIVVFDILYHPLKWEFGFASQISMFQVSSTPFLF